jgi:hypothetical protein
MEAQSGSTMWNTMQNIGAWNLGFIGLSCEVAYPNECENYYQNCLTFNLKL